jgi:hypothetical protein
MLMVEVDVEVNVKDSENPFCMKIVSILILLLYHNRFRTLIVLCASLE